ncbi:hypothetical protein IFM89_011818 [Coptis chinensis]|uniref:Polygalacturonase n=1 Tax=Coptis chinensis TaxID=261450 RepID=A0A835H5N9_9MAGN|nr:hypothetical protein IFM89_011818 [Coptis chinensis]
MNDVKNPIIIDQNYCDQDNPCKEQKSAVQISNVLFKNIKGTSASEVAIKLDSSKTRPCQGIKMQAINLVGENGHQAFMIAWKKAMRISNVFYKNIKGTSASEVAVNFDCSRTHPCKGIIMQDIQFVGEEGNSVEASCKNVELTKIGKNLPSCSRVN